MVRQNNDRLTCECPSGHRLRGPVSLIGQQIKCPKCRCEFIFGETYKNHVSDTAVVRILGEAPEPPRIPALDAESRPCSRCGVAVAVTATVCDHCKCYVGAMPDFMKSMGEQNRYRRA